MRTGRDDDRPLARMLVASALGEPFDATDKLFETDLRTVVAAGRLHRIAPAMARTASRWPQTPEAWTAALQSMRIQQNVRHLHALEDLRVVGEILDAEGIAWVVAKGPVLASAVWPRPDMREYFDLDLVVERGAFEHAVEVLLAEGADLLDRNWPLLRATNRAELAMRAPRGTALDLHWHIAVPGRLRREFPVDVEAMLARRSRVVLPGGLEVPVFDSVDQSFHVAFHAAQAGANRLMWLADVRYSTGVPGFDWTTLAARSRESRAEVPVGLVLDRVDRTIGLNPSAEGAWEHLRDAADGAWARLARARDARNAFPGLPGDRRIGGNVYASARGSLTRSLVGLVARNLHARRAARRPPERELRQVVDDACARREYFDAVRTPNRSDAVRPAASAG